MIHVILVLMRHKYKNTCFGNISRSERSITHNVSRVLNHRLVSSILLSCSQLQLHMPLFNVHKCAINSLKLMSSLPIHIPSRPSPANIYAVCMRVQMCICSKSSSWGFTQMEIEIIACNNRKEKQRSRVTCALTSNWLMAGWMTHLRQQRKEEEEVREWGKWGCRDWDYTGRRTIQSNKLSL